MTPENALLSELDAIEAEDPSIVFSSALRERLCAAVASAAQHELREAVRRANARSERRLG